MYDKDDYTLHSKAYNNLLIYISTSFIYTICDMLKINNDKILFLQKRFKYELE